MKKYEIIIKKNPEDDWIDFRLNLITKFEGDSILEWKELFNCGGDWADRKKFENEMDAEIKRRNIGFSEIEIVEKC